MNKKLLLASLTLITIFFSCEKEAIDIPVEEENQTVVAPTKKSVETNKISTDYFKDEAPDGSWKLIKIVERSGNDVTNSCNRNDFLVFKSDTEFSETRFLIKNKSCENVGTFNFTSFEKNGKQFFTEPNKDTLKGSYEFKDNHLIVTYFDSEFTKTTVTYSK